MSVSNSEELLINRAPGVELQQIVPLMLGLVMLTVGLAMFLSGTTDGLALIQPCIVVFGGTTVAMLATFPVSHIGQALQLAFDRGILGGTSVDEMIRALLKVCDISRRDGLLGVAEVRTDSRLLGNVCELIGDAAEDQSIRNDNAEHRERETMFHQSHTDVFMFTAIYALMIGVIGSVLRAVAIWGDSGSSLVASAGQGLRNLNSDVASAAVQGVGVIESSAGLLGVVVLPAICGVSLALLLTILLGRLRHVHRRELAVIDLAYQGAAIILEDNNVQRLKNRLLWSIPHGTQ